MSLNRNEKAAVVSDVAAQAARSQTLALAEYRGLTVEALNKLRVDARANEQRSECRRDDPEAPHHRMARRDSGDRSTSCTTVGFAANS